MRKRHLVKVQEERIAQVIIDVRDCIANMQLPMLIEQNNISVTQCLTKK